MRPGPIRPGDVRLAQMLDPASAASMRPGPIRPGDGATEAVEIIRHKALQ